MEVHIASKEDVRPSSPTPPHLTTFKLSLLDQLIPAPYAPIILFYMNDQIPTDIASVLKMLKQSLSETLTSYYPLAGRIGDGFSIDCNDGGVNMVVARVNCDLKTFLKHPDPLSLLQLLPCERTLQEATCTHVSNVQVNVFECGGIAIGVCISHKVLDGAALSGFLNRWAATARGYKVGNSSSPAHLFRAADLFPANDDDLWLRDASMPMWRSLFRKGKCITRRFVFDGSAITKLKAQASESGMNCPTRVEVISAFLWKCAMTASRVSSRHGQQTPSSLTHLVNLRTRIVPPLPENSTGNLLWIAHTSTLKTDNEFKPQTTDLAILVRDAISKVDTEFVNKIKGLKRKSVMTESLKEIKELGHKINEEERGIHIAFSSWCGLGYYETDFGWGSPLWVTSVGVEGSEFMNLVMLVETRTGDGIEAWVTLDVQEMEKLVADNELLESASIDPSPLLYA